MYPVCHILTYNSNWIRIRIRIDIIKNTICSNIMLMTFYLFSDNTRIELEDNRMKAF